MHFFDSRWAGIYRLFVNEFCKELQKDTDSCDAWRLCQLEVQQLENVLIAVYEQLYKSADKDDDIAFYAQEIALTIRQEATHAAAYLNKKNTKLALSKPIEDHKFWHNCLERELKNFSSDWLRHRLCLKQYNEFCDLTLNPDTAQNKMLVLLHLHRLHGGLDRAYDHLRYDILAIVTGGDERLLSRRGGLYAAITEALKEAHMASPERIKRLLAEIIMAYDKTGEITNKPKLPTKSYNNLVRVDTFLSSYMPYLLSIFAAERQQKAKRWQSDDDNGQDLTDRAVFQAWQEKAIWLADLDDVIGELESAEVETPETGLGVFTDMFDDKLNNDKGMLLAVVLVVGAENIIYQDADLLMSFTSGKEKLSFAHAARLSEKSTGERMYTGKIKQRAEAFIEALPEELRLALTRTLCPLD